MKTLFQINRVFFIIMLVLFLTFFLGLLMMPVVGAVQVLSAIYLYSQYKNLSFSTQRKLNIYSVLSTVLLTTFVVAINNSSHDFFIIPLTGCGFMSISFMYILYKNYKEEEVKLNQEIIL